MTRALPTAQSICPVCTFGIVDDGGTLYKAARSCPSCPNAHYHLDCLAGVTTCATCGQELVDATTPLPAAPEPVVPTTNDSLDTSDTLGGFDRRFTWSCPATANGYIVQQIIRDEQVFDANGTENTDLSHHDTYWEAWPVVNGVVMFPDMTTPMTGASHDAWSQQSNRDQRAGRYGNWSMTGNVHWLPFGAQEMTGFVENSVDSASGLLATRDDPGIGGATVLVHSRQGEWDGRTAEAGLAMLKTDAENSVLAASQAEAVDELADNGFARDVAEAAVQLFLADGGVFPESEEDSD